VLADLTGGFGAAAALGLLVTASAAAFALLPETRGVELADLEDDAQGGHGRRA
jgi:hypothetical protein